MLCYAVDLGGRIVKMFPRGGPVPVEIEQSISVEIQSSSLMNLRLPTPCKNCETKKRKDKKDVLLRKTIIN